MSHAPSEIDANFYRLIHLLVGSQEEEEDEPAERRTCWRNPFPTIQRISPRRGSDFPEDSEFFEVQCCDLTRAGFSFLLPRRPNFTSLVAAFGGPAEVIYVAAEVSHCQDVLLHRSGFVEPVHDPAGHPRCQAPDQRIATPMVQVGCRFTKRLEKP